MFSELSRHHRFNGCVITGTDGSMTAKKPSRRWNPARALMTARISFVFRASGTFIASVRRAFRKPFSAASCRQAKRLVVVLFPIKEISELCNESFALAAFKTKKAA